MELGKAVTERAEMLEKTLWSKEFSWRELEELAKYMNVEAYKKDSVIFDEGDQKAFMGVVFMGKVNILKESESEKKLITSIGAGKLFGEMSLIDGNPRSATAIACEYTILIVLSQHEFSRILDEKPRMGAKILQKIATIMSYRLRETTGVLADYLGKD